MHWLGCEDCMGPCTPRPSRKFFWLQLRVPKARYIRAGMRVWKSRFVRGYSAVLVELSSFCHAPCMSPVTIFTLLAAVYAWMHRRLGHRAALCVRDISQNVLALWLLQPIHSARSALLQRDLTTDGTSSTEVYSGSHTVTPRGSIDDAQNSMSQVIVMRCERVYCAEVCKNSWLLGLHRAGLA